MLEMPTEGEGRTRFPRGRVEKKQVHKETVLMGDAICGCFGNPYYDSVAECKTCHDRVKCRKKIRDEVLGTTRRGRHGK